MASRKHKRYGMGGFKHKQTPNAERPNGKAWKKFPKGFSLTAGRLVSTQVLKGTSFVEG
jgi:hypothetical protein